MSNRHSVLTVILVSVLTLALVIGNTFFEAFVFMKLYEWFLFNLFNTPTISYWQSMGISITITFALMGILVILATKNKDKDDDESDTLGESLGREIAITVIVAILFGIAALVQLGV